MGNPYHSKSKMKCPTATTTTAKNTNMNMCYMTPTDPWSGAYNTNYTTTGWIPTQRPQIVVGGGPGGQSVLQ